MNRTSSAIALGCLVVIALVAVMLVPKTYRHDAGAAAQAIERAVDRAFAGGLRPCEFGGTDGTAAVAKAVLAAM